MPNVVPDPIGSASRCFESVFLRLKSSLRLGVPVDNGAVFERSHFAQIDAEMADRRRNEAQY